MSEDQGNSDRGDEVAVLRERSALLQSVINTSPEAIVVIGERGIIRAFSPKGEQMFGYTADEVIGQNVSILMASEVMLAKPDVDPAALGEITAKATSQVERAREIVRHFRSFVHKGDTERRSMDMNELVKDALALALIGAEENGIATEVRLTPSVPAIEVDGVQVQQVILNLVRNAMEALSEVDSRRLLIATSWQDGDVEVEFEVRDSGLGLPPEIKDKLFQPFMTTKENGMGIGLSLCRSIVNAHDGRIWADDNDWGGTTFRFVLPVTVKSGDSSPPRAARTAPTPQLSIPKKIHT